MGGLRDKCSVRDRIDENVKQIKVKIIKMNEKRKGQANRCHELSHAEMLSEKGTD